MPEGVKTSRMEARLAEEIATTSSQRVADCKRAELAAYLARLGRFDDCLKILSTVRQRNESNPAVELSIRIHFAEGIHSYFVNDGVSSSDGIQRAHALSAAAGLHELQALAAAWLAQWAYTRVDIKTLRKYVVEALRLANPENHASRSRSNLVVAQVLHLADRFDLAQPWYHRAKEHATAGSDGATIGALMHNMSWQRMLVLRRAVLTSTVSVESARHVLVSADSTDHFNKMIGDSSWRNLQPLLRAQILSLRGEAEQALVLYQENLEGNSIPDRWHANLAADKAWCHAVSGYVEEARGCASRAIHNLAEDTQVDDRAATHSRLAQTYLLLGDSINFDFHNARANLLWQQFEEILTEAVAELTSFDENGVNIKAKKI